MTHKIRPYIEPDIMVRPWPKEGEMTVYLLHFPDGLFRRHHYIGVTQTRTLHLRMIQHACGVGSKITRALAMKNERFYLVRLWRHEGFTTEKRLKAAGHYARHCPLCTNSPQHQPLHTIYTREFEKEEARRAPFAWASSLPRRTPD